jgi:hypothetical protein
MAPCLYLQTRAGKIKIYLCTYNNLIQTSVVLQTCYPVENIHDDIECEHKQNQLCFCH